MMKFGLVATTACLLADPVHARLATNAKRRGQRRRGFEATATTTGAGQDPDAVGGRKKMIRVLEDISSMSMATVCIADGDKVGMDLYEGPYGPQVDTPVQSLCCSGKCDTCTCISGAWWDEDGRQVFAGSCSGTCGAETLKGS